MSLIPLEHPELRRLPALSLHLPTPPARSCGERRVCLLVAQGRASALRTGGQPADLAAERRRRRLLVRRLQGAGVTVLECPEPLPRRPGGWSGADAIVHRHKVLLALFALVAELFPATPTVIAAEGDSALCAAALLRVPRGTTAHVVQLVALGAETSAGPTAPGVPTTFVDTAHGDEWSRAAKAVLALIDQSFTGADRLCGGP